MKNTKEMTDSTAIKVEDKTIHVLFQDPPASSRRGRQSKWITVVDQLKANPGQWALLVPSTKNASTAAYLKGQYGLDATIRKVDEDGNVAIYARFIPEGTEEMVTV